MGCLKIMIKIVSTESIKKSYTLKTKLFRKGAHEIIFLFFTNNFILKSNCL